MRIFYALMFVFFALPATAGEVRVSSIKSQTDEGFCKKLERHQPRADVNFKPSDYSGVSADIGGGLKAPINDPIRIPVEIELLDRLDLGAIEDIAGIDLDVDVAGIEVFQDGRVLYNGQDVSQQIAFHCGSSDQSTDNGVQVEEGEPYGDAPIIPLKKPKPPKKTQDNQKPVDPNAIEVEILEGQFP